MDSDRLTPFLLEEALRHHYHPHARVLACERGPVGNGQEVWFATVASEGHIAELVIRRTASGGPLDWTDREREFRLLERLARTGLPVPTPLFFEPDGGRLGRAAFAMVRLPGEPVRRPTPELARVLGAELGTFLARLHRLDPDLVGKPGGGSAMEATAAELANWWNRYLYVRPGAVPLLGALFAWLRRNQPERSLPPVILWGDPGIYNLLHDGGRVTGLLDWELWHLGDPLEDVAVALSSLEGATADPLVEAYEREIGHPIDRAALAWFTVYTAVQRAVMLLTGVANVEAGRSRMPSHAGLGLELLPRLLRRAARAASWPAPPTSPEEVVVPQPDPWRLHPDVPPTLQMVSSFLLGEVMKEVTSPFTRRGLKTVAALLATVERRVELEREVNRRRAKAAAALLAELGEEGGGPERLEEVAMRAEAEDHFAPHRALIRSHLLADLDHVSVLLTPLQDLYRR
ncbi:MAG: hypothetical protein KatS3mg011_2372 [Acidimicrobiia bacterium]|nr:MAG: hypothetical protein KatS3mg011_2372 [Acidimicrobiia bacterium]